VVGDQRKGRISPPQSCYCNVLLLVDSETGARLIYTASQFKNEVDVLEIRLGTIGDMVDVVVLAEATVDQRGRPKELEFPKHQERFAPWADKIRYVVVDDMPAGTRHADDVARERWQRDALIRGMYDIKPLDLVYVSDLDEIPTQYALSDALNNPPMRFPMDLHVYTLNWRWLDRGCRAGTLGGVVLGQKILELGVCGAILWDSSVPSRGALSGHHLTYQGGVEKIRSKITGMMDKAIDLIDKGALARGLTVADILTDDWIMESIMTGRDVFAREYRPSEWVGLEDMPMYVREHPEKFSHMMVPEPLHKPIEPRCTCGGIYEPNGMLAHFSRCALAALPETLLHPDADDIGGLRAVSRNRG